MTKVNIKCTTIPFLSSVTFIRERWKHDVVSKTLSPCCISKKSIMWVHDFLSAVAVWFSVLHISHVCNMSATHSMANPNSWCFTLPIAHCPQSVFMAVQLRTLEFSMLYGKTTITLFNLPTLKYCIRYDSKIYTKYIHNNSVTRWIAQYAPEIAKA